MDERQVDPKLFVTCRLCLEDLGQYQIVPSVQQQIKYCFDIEVEPFDGLPQLICMKCKEVLNKFHTVKTTFCEKQADLKNKVTKKEEIFCIQPQQDTVSSSQQAPETIEPCQPVNQITNDPCNSKKKTPKRKRLILQSSSSSDDESEQSFQTSKPPKRKSSRQRSKSPMPWEADFKKVISCKLCHSVWLNRRALAVHNQTHKHLREKYKHVFNRQCTVNLIKIDDKPNITGLRNMVVHSSNKIVAPGNSYFYTIYSKEDVASPSNFKSSLQNEDRNKCFSQESSDGEEVTGFKPTEIKTRPVSRSSNETVVIGSHSNKLLSDDEDDKSTVRNSIEGTNVQCINIDDSSDSESDQGKLEKSGKVKRPIEAKLGDYKIIQGIISMCVNSYHKKMESADVDMLYMNVDQKKKKATAHNESQLKHKLLSIGRKTINKQGFNCTGLLRYMEHKRLEIMWMAKTQSLHHKDTNYIRILTKLRGDLNLDDDSGWVDVSASSQPKPSESVPLNTSITIAVPNISLSNVPVSNDSTAGKTGSSMLPNIVTSQPEHINNQAKLDAIPAMLSYLDGKASTSDAKKLLNANPVANPKQLPKKVGLGNEPRSNKTVAQHSLSHNSDINSCWPIITSTTSLAAIPSKEQDQDSNKKNTVTSEEKSKTETTVPRIKVKPASELMSERVLDIMKEQTTVVSTSTNMFVSQLWPQQQPINAFVPNNMLASSQTPEMSTVNTNNAFQQMSGAMTSNTIPEYLILDTTDFPNTKTDSPVKYVKDLLQLHNIFLLDPILPLPKTYNNLVKYKVVFMQDNLKELPVRLCLTLACLKNNLILQVRNKNMVILDVTKFPAYWQWEIFQTLRGDVSKKVLQNARKFGQATYDLTNNFFCLLKTINCRNPLQLQGLNKP